MTGPSAPANQINYHRKSRLTIIVIIFFVTVCASWLIQSYIGERIWFVTLFTYLPQHGWLAVAVPLVVYALFKRRLVAIALSLISLGIILVGLMGYRLHPLSPGRGEIEVMTYNVAKGTHGGDKVINAITALDADIVFLQEVSTPLHARLKKLRQYNYLHYGSQGTLSRWKVISSQPVPLQSDGTPYTRDALEVTVESPDNHQIKLLNVHFRVAMTEDSLFKNRNLSRYLQQTGYVRARQAEQVLKWKQQNPGATIIAGDFNTPPRGVVYRRLGKLGKEAFYSSGSGFGHTYSTRTPVLRIDHIYLDGFTSVECQTLNETASDHRPLAAMIRFSD